jgi:hypothetical protein
LFTSGLTDWFIGWMMVRRLTARFTDLLVTFGWLVSCMAGLTCWPTWLIQLIWLTCLTRVDWLTSGLADWLPGCLANCQTGWIVGQLTGWLAGWLAGWLTSWLAVLVDLAELLPS